MTSFLKQTLPQTSNHLTQMQMKRNTLTALLALALSAWAVTSAQAQTEEQQLNHAVSYDLPRLVAQKGVENVYDIAWTDDVTYGDVFHQNEFEQSTYAFDLSDEALLFDLFDKDEA